MYELATDVEASIIYALMVDGEVKVFDAAGSLGNNGCEGAGPLWCCQIITHDPSPRALGTEARGVYRRWRESVGLSDPVSAESNGKTGEQGCDRSRLGIVGCGACCVWGSIFRLFVFLVTGRNHVISWDIAIVF